MCGIAGWIDCRRLCDSAAIMRRMAQTMVPRGPDSGGLYTDDNCALAHRRLSVIDPARSAQPMTRKPPSTATLSSITASFTTPPKSALSLNLRAFRSPPPATRRYCSGHTSPGARPASTSSTEYTPLPCGRKRKNSSSLPVTESA